MPKRFSRDLGALVTMIALAVVVVSCAPAAEAPDSRVQPATDQPQRGGILNLGIDSDPPTLDLHAASTSRTSSLVQPSMNPLIRYDPLDPVMAKVEPNLAERWELGPDGKAYTFYLRKGVKFHQGGDFTASDAAFSFDRQKQPAKGQVRPRRAAFEPVERFEVVDDYTLRVVMKRPYPSFLPNIAQGWMAMLDQEWVMAGHDPEKEVNGTGPFIFKEYVRGTSAEHIKFPGYWKEGRPYLDAVKYFIIPDEGTTKAACRTMKILMCGGLDTTEQAGFTKELGDKIHFEQSPARWGGNFINMSTLNKPFDDVRVRRAVAYAVSREDALKVLWEGQGYDQGYMPAKGPWAISKEELAKFPGYGPDVEKNRAEAKRLLAEAGYPNGFNVTLGVRKVAGVEGDSIFLKDQLAKIGVIGTLQIIETQAAYELLGKGDYQIFTWSTAYAFDDPDAIFAEHYLCNAPRNYSMLCIPEVDALYEKQTVATDPATRKKLVNEMEKAALNAMPKVNLPVNTNEATAIWNILRDWRVQPSGYSNRHFDETWLAQ